MRFLKFNAGRGMLGSPVTAVLAVLVAVLLSVSAGRIVLRARVIHREREAMAERIRELESERERLRGAIAALGTTEAVERLAKERLNLKQPGEEVVVVTPQPQPSPTPQPSLLQRLIPSWLRELFGFLQR